MAKISYITWLQLRKLLEMKKLRRNGMVRAITQKHGNKIPMLVKVH